MEDYSTILYSPHRSPRHQPNKIKSQVKSKKQQLIELFGKRQSNINKLKQIRNHLQRNDKNAPVGTKNKIGTHLKLIPKLASYPHFIPLMVMSTNPLENGLLVNWSRVADLNNKKAIASWNHHETKQELFERLIKNKSNQNELLRILFPKMLKKLEWVIVNGDRKNLLLVHKGKFSLNDLN
jgi:hypothetical protein